MLWRHRTYVTTLTRLGITPRCCSADPLGEAIPATMQHCEVRPVSGPWHCAAYPCTADAPSPRRGASGTLKCFSRVYTGLRCDVRSARAVFPVVVNPQFDSAVSTLVADSAERLQFDCFSVTIVDMKWGIGKHRSSNLSVRKVVPTLTSNERWDLPLDGPVLATNDTEFYPGSGRGCTSSSGKFFGDHNGTLCLCSLVSISPSTMNWCCRAAKSLWCIVFSLHVHRCLDANLSLLRLYQVIMITLVKL
jgi:hypothetical protein